MEVYNLEAYFHSDPRIEEWVNQIIENILTVDQLTGVDSEVEFEKGREIVANLTHVLQGISIFPAEYLEDGMKQLLEQKFSGSQVINIVAFQDTMNKMLHEGMKRAVDTQNKGDLEIPAFYEKDMSDNTKEDVRENTGENENGDKNTGSLVSEYENEVVTDMAIPALASVKVNEPVDHLENVLSSMFPNVPVYWKPSLMGQTFLAQVEDILIWHYKPEYPCDIENFNKEGWKVYECSSEDLMFPRRLERGIRQLKRLRKKGKQG